MLQYHGPAFGSVIFSISSTACSALLVLPAHATYFENLFQPSNKEKSTCDLVHATLASGKYVNQYPAYTLVDIVAETL